MFFKLLFFFVIFVLACFLLLEIPSFFLTHFELLLVLSREVKFIFVVAVVRKVSFNITSSILQYFNRSCKVNFALEELFGADLVQFSCLVAIGPPVFIVEI